MASVNTSESEPATAQHPITLAELEVFLNNELQNSQIEINEELLDCSSSSSIEPTETNKMNAVALAMTKTLRENIILRTDVDSLQKRLTDLESSQHSKFVQIFDEKATKMNRIMYQIVEESGEHRQNIRLKTLLSQN